MSPPSRVRPTTATRQGMEPLVQESTPSMIAGRVRKGIGDGTFSPGSQLGEAELARELGVSRGPLREGLQRLTQEGLLLSIRNRGLFVVEMTPERVRDMYVARQAVERAAAEQVHVNDPIAGGERLMTVIASMEVSHDSAQVGEHDIAFHELLVTLAASPRLSQMHQTLITETRMCIHALEETYSEGEVRVEEHRAIAQSFLDRKPRVTDRLLVAHMKDAIKRLVPTP